MKRIFLTLAITILGTGFLNQAHAECKIAIGGPGAIPSTLESLSKSLTTMTKGHHEYNLQFFTVSTFAEAVNTDADFMVYLKGDSLSARFQFRDIGANAVMYENFYSYSMTLDKAIAGITSDVEANVLKQLPRYCQKH